MQGFVGTFGLGLLQSDLNGAYANCGVSMPSVLVVFLSGSTGGLGLR